MAKQTVVVAVAPAVVAVPQTVVFNANAVMRNGKPASTLRANTARARYVALAQQHNGKPLAGFAAAAIAQGVVLHGPKSIFTARGQAQAFSGWLSWLVRNNIVTLKS